MTESFFPPPLIDPDNKLHPLERLKVYDSLMIDANRWRKAHEYHRLRQNICYQSLNQPGIVNGLGVSVTNPPKEVSANFRILPWLKIQPGIAIDWEGNPIIVPQAVNFPLRLPETTNNNPIDLYVVISYRDPEVLKSKSSGETLQETFRLDQKTNAPCDGEVELCRIQWQPEITTISNPQNVIFPQLNEIDLRQRLQAKNRAEATVRISARNSLPNRVEENLACLMTSISALYPNFTGVEQPNLVLLRTEEVLNNCDLFYLLGEEIEQLDRVEIEILARYVDKGGVILVEATDTEQNLEIIAELVSQRFDIDNTVWQRYLHKKHPLKRQPFLFAVLPEINRCPIELWHDNGGIILVEGELSAAWGFDEELLLSRENIRSAQEFGINLLHFAWNRRKLTHFLAID